MEIKWDNLFVVMLIIVAAVIGLKQKRAIAVFVNGIGNIGSQNMEEQLKGFLALGLLVIALLAALSILRSPKP